MLGYESLISGMYSGISTVSMKIICGFLGIYNEPGVDSKQATWGLILAFILLIYSTLLNLLTLNNLLGLYPSLKAVPYYQSFIIITGILASGICLNEFAAYKFSQLLMIGLGTLVCMGGIYNKIQG